MKENPVEATEYVHHPNCRANYPEKPPGEQPQHIVEIPIDDGEVVLQCSDCGAFIVEKMPPCEETWGMIGDKYLRCGKPSISRIQHRGRDEGPYYMCLEHAWHNVHNRNAEVIEGEKV